MNFPARRPDALGPTAELWLDVPDAQDVLEPAAELRPDVALVGIRTPRLDGLEVTRRMSGWCAWERGYPVPQWPGSCAERVHGAEGMLRGRAEPARWGWLPDVVSSSR
ncbi:hypothetical protein ACH4E7_26410 [Kitasatospora sp. NPDC018058]|uniref:hypothetical protein n=1 Tax=Kitasatospora sp. NPDC018058 TaxID=3364025 RepID=UPI0037C0EC6B